MKFKNIASRLVWALPLLLSESPAWSEAQSHIATETWSAHGFFKQAPNAFSVENFIQQTMPNVINLHAESGAFSGIDPHKLSIDGDPWSMTQWWLNGVNITDTLFAGSAAFHVPHQFLSDVRLARGFAPHSDLGIHLLSDATPRDHQNSVGAALWLPNMGGITPGSIEVMNRLSSAHALARPIAPPENLRRQLTQQGLFFFNNRASLKNLDIQYGADFKIGQRQFLNFSPRGEALDSFSEDFTLLSLAMRITPHHSRSNYFLLAEYRDRNHLSAELGYAPALTNHLRSATLFGSGQWQLKEGKLAAGLTLKLIQIASLASEITRDVLMPGGMSPLLDPAGGYFTAHANLNYERSLFYLKIDEHLLTLFPDAASSRQILTLDGAPYGFAEHNSARAFELFGAHQVGLKQTFKRSIVTLAYSAYGWMNFYVNGRAQNSVLHWDVGLSGSLEIAPKPYLTLFLALSKTPVPLTSQITKLLDPAYLNTRTYLGDAPTSTQLIDTSGGRFVSDVAGLKNMNVYALSTGVRAQPLREFGFSLQGIGKIYQNPPWMQFASPLSENGRFVGDVFYLNSGEKYYRFAQAPFEKPPIYLGIQVDIVASRSDRYIVQLGFSAANNFGGSAFGNGLSANDIGVVNTSMANPNTQQRSYGNLDSDRGYIGKLLVGGQPVRGLWLMSTVAYMDGAPFAFFDSSMDQGQLAQTYRSARGSSGFWNPKGPRVDARWDFVLGVSYTLKRKAVSAKFSAQVHNVFDIGAELTERATTLEPKSRPGLELQIPRSMILATEVSF